MVAAQARNWYAASPAGLLVLRYAEAQELLRDRRLDHNGKRYMEQTCGVFSGPAYDWYVPMIVNRDGEDHVRLRRLMNKTFTPRMIDDLRPFIRARAHQLADQIASAGECEFVEDFATQLPLAVMCHMLGVPPEDYDTFRVWGTDARLLTRNSATWSSRWCSQPTKPPASSSATPYGQRFDITIRRSEQPLQFGGGPHYCLGAALAQAELSEALPILATKLKTPRITGPVTWRHPIGVYGPNQLPLSFG